jgi:undecaprenyl-diphosphatase
MLTPPKPRAVLLAFIALYTGYRLLSIGGFPMSPDEAYYFAWSRAPAVSYYDQPGMVAWVDWLFARPWPRPTAFTVRLGAVALSGLVIWLCYWAYRQYRSDEKEAVAFALVFSTLPFTWLTGIVMIHDTALLPWLILAYGMTARLARDDGRAADWLGLALALTGAMYAKLSAVMAAWGIVLYMIWSPRGRRWWKRWQPYAAGGLVSVLYLPVILWNFQHGWINVKAVGELTATGPLSLATRLWHLAEYLISQPLMFSPLIGLAAFYALLRGIGHAWKRPEDDRVTLPVCLALPVFLYFAQLAFRSRVYGNWPGIAYFPVAMLAWSEIAERRRSGPWTGLLGRRFLLTGEVLNLVFLLLAGFHLQFGILRPAFAAVEKKFNLDRRLDWRLDLDFGGWDELAALTERYRPRADFILTRRYQVASMLEFLLPDQPRVYAENRGLRGNQWDLWPGPERFAGQTALYVDIKRMPPSVQRRCDEVVPLQAPFRVGERKRPVKKWWVYLCRGWKGRDAPGPAGSAPAAEPEDAE